MWTFGEGRPGNGRGKDDREMDVPLRCPKQKSVCHKTFPVILWAHNRHSGLSTVDKEEVTATRSIGSTGERKTS